MADECKRDELPESPPELGTREAAVRSVVHLIALATQQPEAVLAYYLDLYYQVRADYEADKARAIVSRDEIAQTMRDVMAELLGPLPEPVFAADPAAQPEDPAPKPPKNDGHPSAPYKRQVLDRLTEARKGGLTVARIVKASDHALDEATVLAILNRGRVGVDKYRILDAALDRCAAE